VGHADRSIGRNSETNTGNLICDALKYAATTGVVSSSRGLHGSDGWSGGSRRCAALRCVACSALPYVALPCDCTPCPVTLSLPATAHHACPINVLASPAPAQAAAKAVVAANPGLPLVCIENAGGIRTDIPAGNVTMAQISTVLPFGNT